jgi:hypothetical protein
MGKSISSPHRDIVTEDVNQYPLSIAFVGTTFTKVIERNLKKLFHQNQEKDAVIIELEEQLKHGKKDGGNLQEFKACA